jgi:SAM-dependent methyltransferase
MIAAKLREACVVDDEAGTPAGTRIEPPIGLEQYYRAAGPDYAAWSREFNMHFGFYRAGANPFDREAMLERMNREVLTRLRLDGLARPKLLDLGCGLGATLRSFARLLPEARLAGVTKVPWQVEPRWNYDGVYALESGCHAQGADKARLLQEAHRLLKPGGRLVVADGFLAGGGFRGAWQRSVYRRLCECYVIAEFAGLRQFTERLERLGFRQIAVEELQLRVAPSVLHIPWVTLKFLVTDVLLGERTMTRARWNNVLAPLLLPLVSAPLGPMSYCMVSATKG